MTMESWTSKVWNWIWNEEDRAAVSSGFWLLRRISRIAAIVAIEFRKDAIPLRASALTFTIVFSLVPFLALGTAVLKGMGAGDQMKEMAYTFIESLEQASAPLSANTTSPSTGNGGEESATLVSHLKRAADVIFDYVDRTNFATLGILGTLGMLLAVVSVLGNIEESMNQIWQTQSGRPLGRRIMDYLALMILLPVSVNIGLAAMTALQNQRLLDRLGSIIPADWIIPLLIHGFTLTIIVATFVTLYRFLPNTKVPFLPALAGGLLGGTGWLLVQALYLKLQIGVARYNAIYGSFATLPLFLTWIYVGWMVFLTGAELAFAACVWRRYNPKWDSMRPAMRLALALDIMDALYDYFIQRKTPTPGDIALAVKAPEAPVISVVNELTKAEIIRFAAPGDDRLLPVTEAKHLPTLDVFHAIIGQQKGDTPGSRLAAEVLWAARNRLEGITLEDLRSTTR